MRGNIPSLTGLRGAAALWVVAYHLLLPGHLIGGWFAVVAGRGYLAVDLFFVLSGFVMALSYGPAFRGRFGWRVFAAFLWRRVARLYPLYGVVLIGRLVYTGVRYSRFDLPRPWIAAPLVHPWTDIPANLLLVQSWGLAPSSIGPAWSISTEWAAYWTFPLLVAWMLNRGPRAALAGVGVALLLLAATAALLWTEGSARLLDAWNGQTAGPLMRCLGGFMLGLAVWRLAAWPPARQVASHPAAAGLVLTGLVSLLGMQASDLAIYALFPPLVLCLACTARQPGAAFAWVPAVWLGEVSYSLYLLHIFLLHPLDQLRATVQLVLPSGFADALTAVIVLACLLAASDVSYRCIERPGRTLLAGLFRR